MIISAFIFQVLIFGGLLGPSWARLGSQMLGAAPAAAKLAAASGANAPASLMAKSKKNKDWLIHPHKQIGGIEKGLPPCAADPGIFAHLSVVLVDLGSFRYSFSRV